MILWKQVWEPLSSSHHLIVHGENRVQNKSDLPRLPKKYGSRVVTGTCIFTVSTVPTAFPTVYSHLVGQVFCCGPVWWGELLSLNHTGEETGDPSVLKLFNVINRSLKPLTSSVNNKRELWAMIIFSNFFSMRNQHIFLICISRLESFQRFLSCGHLKCIIWDKLIAKTFLPGNNSVIKSLLVLFENNPSFRH